MLSELWVLLWVLSTGKVKRIAISLSIDATAVPESMQLSRRHRVVIGGAWPNHLCSIDLHPSVLETEENLASFIEAKQIRRAQEIKVAMITLQEVATGMPFSFPICARPQTKNEQSSFNDDCYEAIQEVCDSNLEEFTFLNAALDGLATEAKFVAQRLSDFLLGKNNAPVITDINHNMKNLRYQIVGGSNVVTCGTRLVNLVYLQMSNILEALYRVTDWASDKVVLELVSDGTFTSLKEYLNEVAALSFKREDEYKSFLALSLTLYFIHLHLFCANSKILHAEKCIFGLWTSAIWFTNLNGVLPITKKNIVIPTIGLVFVIARDDVKHPRLLTTEPLEHHFGDHRQQKREFTVLEYNESSDKVERANDSIIQGKFVASRDPRKGYQSTAADFVSFVLQANDSGHPGFVKIDRTSDKPVAQQIWDNGMLWLQLRTATDSMKTLLGQFCCSEFSPLTSTCSSTLTGLDELNACLLKYLPQSHRPNQSLIIINQKRGASNSAVSSVSNEATTTTANVPNISPQALVPAVQDDPTNMDDSVQDDEEREVGLSYEENRVMIQAVIDHTAVALAGDIDRTGQDNNVGTVHYDLT